MAHPLPRRDRSTPRRWWTAGSERGRRRRAGRVPGGMPGALALGDGSSTWVTGTIAGDSVRATLCPGAAAMYFEDLGPMYAPAAFGYLSGGLPLYGPGLVFDAPRTAVAWRLDFELDGVFAEDATYESPDGGCGAVPELRIRHSRFTGDRLQEPDASTSCPPGLRRRAGPLPRALRPARVQAPRNTGELRGQLPLPGTPKRNRGRDIPRVLGRPPTPAPSLIRFTARSRARSPTSTAAPVRSRWT